MVMQNFSSTNCVSYVYDLSCFDLLTEVEKELIDNRSLLVNFKKGEMICKQGSFASHIMYLEKGLVKVYLEGNPKDLILTITPQNHLLGLQAIYEGNSTFLYSISTYTDSVVRLIDIQIFEQLLKQNAVFAYRVINILNESTSQSYSRFFSLTQKQLHGRLADIFLCLSRKIFFILFLCWLLVAKVEKIIHLVASQAHSILYFLIFEGGNFKTASNLIYNLLNYQLNKLFEQ